MKILLFCLLISLSINKLHSQEVTYMEYIEPESDFKELTYQLSDGTNSLKIIEKAFLNWDYEILKPILDDKIKENTKDFFKIHKDSIKKYDWKKRTHYGPTFSVIPGGNFGLTIQTNSLRLHSTNKNYKVFEIDYSYYVKDSVLHIYSFESRNYPYKNRLNASLPVVLKTNELTQSLRESIRKKDVEKIKNLLTALEKLLPELSELSFFNESAYNSQLSKNYGNLSWYLIFENKYEEAVKASEKGLKLDAEQTWIYTNLALSNLLAGNKETTLSIYNEYKELNTSNKKSFREVFKTDLKEVKEAGLLSITLYNELLEKLNK